MLRRLLSVTAATAVGLTVLTTPAAAAGSADLVVTAVSPVAPGVQAVGSAVVLTATIKNQGTAATRAGVIHGVAFAVNGRTVSWSDTSTASLGPGESRTLTASSGPHGSNAWTATAGTVTVRARVDDVRRIAESDDGNNTLQARLTSAPVKAPTGVTATAAIDQARFDATHGRAVRVGWGVPAGQPVGVRYVVTEHPTDTDGGWCPESSDLVRASTTGTSATFEMESGRLCLNHGYESYVDTYSVTAVSQHGGPGAVSGRTAQCSWESDGHSQYMNYSFACGSAHLYDAVTGGRRVDAGATSDSYDWEKDQGFTGGKAYRSTATGLPAELTTSRYGFSSYRLAVPPGRAEVTLRMVEPTFTAKGRRVFDLRVNGQLVASRLDVFAEVGRNAEYVIRAVVDAPDGVVEIVPTAVTDHPILASIETGSAG